jgi:hypothetical protein
MSREFSVDTEYGYHGGLQVPSAFVPITSCAIDLGTGEEHVFWGRDPRLADFICGHAGDLFIAHNLIAEAKYLLQVGINPPTSWFDTMTAYRFVTNAEYVKPFGLLKAAADLGLPIHVADAEKKVLQTWVGNLEFNPENPEHRRRIRDYCLGDCRAGAALYRRLVGEVPPTWMSYVVTFCLATARAELRGIPLDIAAYSRLEEQKEAVLNCVLARVNAVYPVFRGQQLDKRALLRWCAGRGVGWPERWSPRTGRKYLPFDDRAFKIVSERDSFLAMVREANKTAKLFGDRDLTVDHDRGRHYYGNVVLAQKTSRTSFKGFLFTAPKWMRWLVTPSTPNHIILSVDFTAEEILIAGYLARDAAMVKGYQAGDAHLNFAVLAGAAPAGASKDDPRYAAVRRRYKAFNLGVNYGQSAYGIAEKTGMYLQEARSLLAQHKRAYPAFWDFMGRYTADAFRRGRAVTKAGWPRGATRYDNARSVANFAVQGTGADLMRLSVIYLTQNKAPLLAQIHDGFLFECHRSQLAEVRCAIDDALRRAVEQLLPGAAMRWTTDVFENRYDDPDGEPLWQLVSGFIGRKTGKNRISDTVSVM